MYPKKKSSVWWVNCSAYTSCVAKHMFVYMSFLYFCRWVRPEAINMLARWHKIGGTRFTNNLWAHNWNLVQIFFAEVMILMIQSDHKFESSNQITNLHRSRQQSCRDLCKIMTWLDHHFSSNNSMTLYKIWIMSLSIICKNGSPGTIQSMVLDINILFIYNIKISFCIIL